ncbi:MAG: iron(III) transport system substrate-binding protein [Actinomycetota bacterium]|jgi:iron(III) transport system substrate-binding protein|nr:iron(III) transport system substrate-binding protein [Actinomycetota bacterium]
MAVAAGLVAVALSAAACGDAGSGSGSGSDKPTLTLYNAQHDFVEDMAKDFTAKTGIKVEVRSGDDFELANQIVQEGSASPADVFVTENSPAMSLVDSKGGFARVDDTTLAQIPDSFEPSNKNWVGFAARSTVLAYNSTALKPADLPASLLDLAQPKWKGKIGFAPAGADFQAIVSAVVATSGEAAAEQWLKGLNTNGKKYQGNTAVMKAVNAGEIQAGVIYHYYWYKDRAESGANSKNVELRYFGNADPGAFVSISGAGVVKASKHQEEAQQLVAYLTGKDGQKILADSGAMEYAIADGATNNPALKPIADLDPPAVDPAKLNGPRVVELMQRAGLL